MKKIFVVVLFLSTYMFAMINLQTASKEELMSISGIGAKRAAAIIRYRKTHKIKSADDLLNIKGIGKNVVNNVKKGVKNKKRVVARKGTKKRGLKKEKKSLKNSKISKKAPKKSKLNKKVKKTKTLKKSAKKKSKVSKKRVKKSKK